MHNDEPYAADEWYLSVSEAPWVGEISADGWRETETTWGEKAAFIKYT